ncbi:flagellin [Herbivorax sp. ANBcel31]|uniref:flagellin N-terminal helical domain-containing protein n=1 Tax=Herbivorax sp. ANBcel31 TaxID=3069754 RepID=UPI0027B214EE|nr:flagellin [Herbivorax sp. ANBcel31]MDQ2085095.1 flagellin [Herbivorax sp. ANBcel31]
MRINNNLMAMNTHRQLGITNNAGSKSMEKLSSGFRINRAGDDAAGLAISEKMRGQIRGLSQASRNAQDGISMIQTAEGALNETHSILQRMRELTVQSANDTNVGVDREEIQKEINQLSSEINRIGNTTEFNTQKLLDGGGVSRLEASGLITQSSPEGGETDHTQAAQLVEIDTVDVSGTDCINVGDGDTLQMTIQGEQITVTFSQDDSLDDDTMALDTDSVTGNSATLNFNGEVEDADATEAIANALNEIIAENDVLSGNYAATHTNVVGGGTGFTTVINGVADNEFAVYALGEDDGGEYYGDQGYIAETADQDVLAGAVDAQVGSTEYTAAEINIDLASYTDADSLDELVGTGFTVDGQQFEFYNPVDGPYTGSAIGISLGEAYGVAESGGTVEEALATTVASQLNSHSTDNYTVEVDEDTATQVNIVAAENGEDGNCSVSVEDGGRSSSFTANLQIGANTAQSMSIELDDMRSNALGITGTETGGTVTANNGAEANYVDIKEVTDGTTNTGTEYALDVSDHEKATAAVSVINDAIETVSAQRSDLGAYQNRLEHTISNLDNSAENLQAAESRIRDVDMAQEMMEFTKQNILQQAAQAMLAQANQAPQGVLQLLG